LGSRKHPKWAQKALQGIAYWIGHQRCLYRDYPLAEAALVAEICNLIYTHLQKPRVLSCEVQYADLFKPKIPPTRFPNAGFGKYSRADLVIYPTKGKACPEFVIEVKRATAPRKLISRDLARLAAIKKSRPATRAFLFIVAEDYRPAMFVGDNGAALSGKRERDGVYYRVLRAYKAAWSYSNKDKVKCNYACVIEVL